eukprot:2888675-Lingulodinium_polyedra.AAC.1
MWAPPQGRRQAFVQFLGGKASGVAPNYLVVDVLVVCCGCGNQVLLAKDDGQNECRLFCGLQMQCRPQ